MKQKEESAMKIKVILLAVMLLAATALAQRVPQMSPRAPQAVPGGDSTYFGKSYGEWSAAWWQWALALPATEHPLFDTADCSTAQSGHVWFLGGKFCAATSVTGGCADPMTVKQVRSCIIKPGTALFFPILNDDDSIIEELPYNPNVTEMDLRVNAKAWENPTQSGFMVAGTLDGKPLSPVRICTKGDFCTPQQSPAIPFTLAAHDNLFTAVGEIGITDGASSIAISDGYYVLLPPLPVGQHTIHFYGLSGLYSLDMTYNITVVP